MAGRPVEVGGLDMQRTGRRLLTTVAQCVILIIVGASIRELCAQADLEPSLVRHGLHPVERCQSQHTDGLYVCL